LLNRRFGAEPIIYVVAVYSAAFFIELIRTTADFLFKIAGLIRGSVCRLFALGMFAHGPSEYSLRMFSLECTPTQALIQLTELVQERTTSSGLLAIEIRWVLFDIVTAALGADDFAFLIFSGCQCLEEELLAGVAEKFVAGHTAGRRSRVHSVPPPKREARANCSRASAPTVVDRNIGSSEKGELR
jgi:hypothetical protein